MIHWIFIKDWGKFGVVRKTNRAARASDEAAREKIKAKNITTNEKREEKKKLQLLSLLATVADLSVSSPQWET